MDPEIAARGFASGFVTMSDGVKIHYLSAGKGPAVVFLPGWTGAAEFWAPQMRLLMAQHQVVSIDPRSQGDSDKAGEGNYTERRARDVHEVITKLKLAPAVLVAWSRGVIEALSLVEQFGTGDLQALVMADGTLNRPTDSTAVEQFQKQTKAMLEDRKRFVAQQVPGMFRRPHAQALYDRIAAANLKTPTPVAITLQADSMGRDSRPALRRIDKPIIFINRSGAGADAIKGILAKELPSAKFAVMNDVGHAIFLDDPERFNELLTGFLRQIK